MALAEVQSGWMRGVAVPEELHSADLTAEGATACYFGLTLA